MAKKSKGYFGMGKLLSIILAIIPITNLILGIVIRIQNKKYLGVILNILLAPLFWIVDLVCIVLYNELKFIA